MVVTGISAQAISVVTRMDFELFSLLRRHWQLLLVEPISSNILISIVGGTQQLSLHDFYNVESRFTSRLVKISDSLTTVELYTTYAHTVGRRR